MEVDLLDDAFDALPDELLDPLEVVVLFAVLDRLVVFVLLDELFVTVLDPVVAVLVELDDLDEPDLTAIPVLPDLITVRPEILLLLIEEEEELALLEATLVFARLTVRESSFTTVPRDASLRLLKPRLLYSPV